MNKNVLYIKLSSIGRLLIAGVVVSTFVLSCQTTSDLTDPRLLVNASIPQNNPPGIPIPQRLVDARMLAPSRGVVWKGLDIIVSDDEAVTPGVSITALLLQQYHKQACQADAAVVGHAGSSSYHLSASGTGVYGDHVFVIDTLLKDNRMFSIRTRPDMVVTRPGGSLSLNEGQVNVIQNAFPQLQPGVAYLLFLRYIPESSAYRAIDALSTLIANGNSWSIARKSFSGLAVPGFTRGELELMIGNWLKILPVISSDSLTPGHTPIPENSPS